MAYSKTCLKQPLKKKTKNCFSRQIIAKCKSKVLQNAPREHFAILSTFIKVPFVFKTFILSFFEWSLKAGITVCAKASFKKDPKNVFKNDYCLMQVNSIAECSKRVFCNTFDLH